MLSGRKIGVALLLLVGAGGVGYYYSVAYPLARAAHERELVCLEKAKSSHENAWADQCRRVAKKKAEGRQDCISTGDSQESCENIWHVDPAPNCELPRRVRRELVDELEDSQERCRDERRAAPARAGGSLGVGTDFLVGAILLLLFFSVLLPTATFGLREKHAGEIYLVWYINTFFFLLFLGMGVVAEKQSARLTEVCGSYEKACETIYVYLTDTRGEIGLIVIGVGLAIGPQVLTYLLSGLSGAASAPKFVLQVETIAIWSFVKFAAALGGILVAEPFARLVTGSKVEIVEFLSGPIYTIGAFSYASTHVWFHDKWLPSVRQRFAEPNGWLLQKLNAIHGIFTRNIPREAKEPPTRDGIIVVALRLELQRRYPSLSEEDAGRIARTFVARGSKLFDAVFGDTAQESEPK
ncbi:hypothetical protein BE61_02400 [Bradyrhizobium elkanii USDA 61]|nr:hypothetical protein QIH80_41570 [Bradyrhizobium elkanii]BBB94830.1 hypothetical protein BE61_02400 [Bradyrhizobium elkanii USDA 61]